MCATCSLTVEYEFKGARMKSPLKETWIQEGTELVVCSQRLVSEQEATDATGEVLIVILPPRRVRIVPL